MCDPGYVDLIVCLLFGLAPYGEWDVHRERFGAAWQTF
jgi:hypothetical protein